MSCVKIDKSDSSRQMRLLAAFSLLSVPFASGASEWIISPAVSLDVIHTDNALLSTDEKKQDETVTRVKPSISIYREGGRGKLDFNYSPEYRYYAKDTRSNETVHHMRASGDMELVENQLFVDAWGTADQTRLSSSRSSPDGLTGPTENVDYYSLGVSPYYTVHFGNTSVLEARYSADTVQYKLDDDQVNQANQADQDDQSEADSTAQTVNLVFGSGTYSVAQVWELSGSHTIEDFSGAKDSNKISRFRGEFLQQITRRWGLSFAAGYEDFQLIEGEDEDGSLWSVGVVFTPTNHTRLAVGGGKRAFGDDYFVDFKHKSDRMVMTLTYNRDYISARDEVRKPTLFQRQDEFGNLVRDAVLDNPPPVTVNGVSTLSAEYYESKRVNASLVYMTQRTRAEVQAGLINRDYQIAGVNSNAQDSRDLNTTVALSRSISGRLRATSRFFWTDHELVNNKEQNYKEWTASLGIGYQLSHDATVSTGFYHLDRKAKLDLNNHKENRVNVGYQMRF